MQGISTNQLLLSGSLVSATGNNLYINGNIANVDTSALATAVNLGTTGSTLYNYINNFSGVFVNSGSAYQNQINTLNNLPKVTGLYITGGNSKTGAIHLTGNNGISVIDSGQTVVYTLPNFSKSLTFEYPAAGDSITLFYTDTPLKINKLITLLSGTSSPTVTFNIRLTTGRNVAPYYSIFSSDQVTTSINTGTLFTTFNNQIMSGNSYAFLDIIATGGTLYKFSETLFYNYL